MKTFVHETKTCKYLKPTVRNFNFRRYCLLNYSHLNIKYRTIRKYTCPINFFFTLLGCFKFKSDVKHLIASNTTGLFEGLWIHLHLEIKETNDETYVKIKLSILQKYLSYNSESYISHLLLKLLKSYRNMQYLTNL